jgi:hypothetical protein
MEMIKVSCFVDVENVKAILDLPQVKETGVSSDDIKGIQEIQIDPDYLPLNDDEDRIKFKNSIIGAAVLRLMQWKEQEKDIKKGDNNE